MIAKVRRCEVRGRVTAPPSKSMTHRALMCSAMAPGKSIIHSPLISEDTVATHRVLSLLGVDISRDNNSWEIQGGSFKRPSSELFCGESGTTLRFTTSLCSFVNGECRLTGGVSLSKRPVGPLLEGLRQLGVDCESREGFPPVTVRGSGRIKSGIAEIRGDISSQFVSALLMIAPLGEGTTTLNLTTPLESKPYVSMTMNVQSKFDVNVQASDDMRAFRIENQSYQPTEISMDGDWSSASYLLAAGAVAGEVTLENLNLESMQADKTIIEILDFMGAEIIHKEGEISIRNSGLTGIDCDLSNSPDLFPVVSVLCAAADGRSVLRGLRRLRFKESDRVTAMVEGLRKMGVKVERERSSLVIHGGKPTGRIVDSHKDHRIAMAFAVLGLIAEGETTILDAECVAKSFPEFWDEMKAIGADVRRIENE